MRKIELFVPGRLCLFGEHSDWAGRYMAQNVDIYSGKAIVTGINLGIYASAQKSDDFKIYSMDEKGASCEFQCKMHRDILKQKALEENFFCYCCGVAAYLRENYHVGGMELKIEKITLPMKKGLSSSAAICVLVAKAFNELYDLRLSTRGIMKVAYAGERLTKSRCGRLDQACAFGTVPVEMEFLDEDIVCNKLNVGKTLYYVFADLCAQKDTKKILTALNRAYPFAQNEEEKAVQYALGEANHEIVKQAKEAMAAGDDKRLGELMNEAQALFDKNVMPACPEELEAPVLHSTLVDERVQPWIYGGKGVGSQGDGTVQFLAKDKESQQALVKYLNEEKGMQAYGFEIQAGGKVKKAIIPIAGFGTRMYPETHFVKKAFLPIMDKNGVVKPVLMCILEELDAAEIEEIILIVGEGEEKEYREVFDFEPSVEFEERLPIQVRDSYREIRRLGKKLRYVEQREKKGFGHAVYQAKSYLKGEPALLMLGDFIYHSHRDEVCAAQTIQTYNASGGKAVVSVKSVPLEQVPNYGIIAGDFLDSQKEYMDVRCMVEKPSIQYAEEFLGVRTSDISGEEGQREFFATFGQYVLTHEIFEYLEIQIMQSEQVGYKGEIDLTSALQFMAEKNQLVALKVAGESYDVGIPSLYYETFQMYHKLERGN